MIKEGDYGLFKKGEFLKIFQIKKSKPVLIDRFKCELDSLVGQPFGFHYEVVDKKFKRKTVSDETSDTNNGTVQPTEGKDNRNLLDECKNQKLTRDEIEEMKSDLSGIEIIEKLVENSTSFENKTDYSKEKYLKKKKEKYLPIYQILRPTIRTLSDYYMQGNFKRKILNMRIDTIGQILTYANVAAYRNVMVVESCKGLLVGAIAERLGGFGTIINLSQDGASNNSKFTLDQLNLAEDIQKVINNFPLEKSDKIEEYIADLKKKIEIAHDEGYKEKQIKKLQNAEAVAEILLKKQVDCFVMSCKYKPLPILERLIKYMGLGRWFVIYSQIQDPLIECFQYFKETQTAVHLEISDSWLREYQVLPERTHPKVMMDCCSGYLLTGITVSNQLS